MYLFVCFHSPMYVRTAHGTIAADPGNCVLFDPSFPQWYQGREAGFIDDWLHLDGSDVPAMVRLYRIPLNTLLRPRGTEFVTPIFEAINRELRRREPLWRESVCLLVQSLFLQLGRELVQQPEELTPAEAARLDEFRNLRMNVHERMQEQWRVADMARLAHLSPSRFAVLYTKLLGISPSVTSVGSFAGTWDARRASTTGTCWAAKWSRTASDTRPKLPNLHCLSGTATPPTGGLS
jgi:AraC-like DNA-binding protein